MKCCLKTYSPFELVGVGFVGLLLSGMLRFMGLGGLLIGTGTYLLGYLVRGNRPETGWFGSGGMSPIAAYLPESIQARLPGE